MKYRLPPAEAESLLANVSNLVLEAERLEAEADAKLGAVKPETRERGLQCHELAKGKRRRIQQLLAKLYR